jgi:hypothetical protein
MKTANKTPRAGGTAAGAQDTIRSAKDALHRAFIQRSRFHSSIVVADRHAFAGLAQSVLSRDALYVLKAARAVGAAYLVLAGQLHRAKAPCVGFIIKDAGNIDLLENAYAAAFDRLTELGETDSLSFLALGDVEVRGRIESLLSELSATEGAA